VARPPKRHSKAVVRRRAPAKQALPVRLSKAQVEELDRRADDLASGRTKGTPLDVVLDEDVRRR